MPEPGLVPGNAARRRNRWRSARVTSTRIQEPDMKKRATLYSLCATAMAMCGLVLGAVPASASIHNTPGYFHIANVHSGKCVDAFDPGGNTNFPGFLLTQQWRCLNTPFEEWKFVPYDDPNGRTDLFQIVNNQTGQCLEIFGPRNGDQGAENGDPVGLNSCDPGFYGFLQAWSFGSGTQPPSGSPFQLVNPWSGSCLDLENGDTSDGVVMQVWACNAGTSNQRWQKL